MTFSVIGFFRRVSLAVLLAASCQAAKAADMTFQLVDTATQSACRGHCPQVIAASGEIVESTPQAFIDFARAASANARVRSILFINSPGGRVTAAMRLGIAFRRVGAAVVVARAQQSADAQGEFSAGRCFSACVYALMGAKKRIIPPQSQVGIHRMFQLESGRDPAGGTGVLSRKFGDPEMVSTLSKYTAMMGVSPDLIRSAEQISPDTIHIVTAAEMARWRLGSARF